MSYKTQKEFVEELVAEFNLNKDAFHCYTLESNPLIRVIIFGKNQWNACHIGILVNHRFHVLGVGSFSFINEDAKALYVALACALPQEEQKLKVIEFSLFNDEEQESIIKKLKEIYPNT